MFRSNTVRAAILSGLFAVAGCATASKTPIHLAPGFEFAAIDAIEVLRPVDVRADKSMSVNLQKQILEPVAKTLKKKGYRVTQDANFGTSEFTEDDLREAKPEWIKRLGSPGARWVVVMCLVDVRTKLTFGSTGNAEIAAYLFDKAESRVAWRDKGVGQVGQGGLAGMLMKSGMDNSAISAALANVMASFPKRKG
jgi:hypothetical protein